MEKKKPAGFRPKPVFRPKPAFRPKRKKPQFPEGFVRVRLPKTNQGEVLGVIQEHFGNKLLVKCMDGHTRTCRIPGKIRYKLRVRIGDVVLVKKWIVQSDIKADYLYRYTRTQVNQLIKKGFLKREDLA